MKRLTKGDTLNTKRSSGKPMWIRKQFETNEVLRYLCVKFSSNLR